MATSNAAAATGAEAVAPPLTAAFSVSAGVAANEKVVHLEAKLEAMLETQRAEEVNKHEAVDMIVELFVRKYSFRRHYEL